MVKSKQNLIPRYNWDYSFSTWLTAMSAIFSQNMDQTQEIRKYFGQDPLWTTSGRASLYTILSCLELAEGAGVAVPLFCCQVVFEAIRKAGMTPVFIDINKDDYNMSADSLNQKKNSFSAVIAVHMFGHPADMDEIRSVAGTKPVIEDCAQSLSSEYKGKRTGFLSDASFFSFRSGKYVSAGEGSAIFCKDKFLLEKISAQVRIYGKWGKPQQISHCISNLMKSALYKRPLYGKVGYPLGRLLDRKMNLTAKTGLQLKAIAECNLKIINERLGSISSKITKQRNNALNFLNKIHFRDTCPQYEKKNCQSNYFQFPIRFSDTTQRDAKALYLLKKGIDTARYLDDIKETATQRYGYRGDCPNAEAFSKKTLIIPNYYTLSNHDLEYIISCLNIA